MSSRQHRILYLVFCTSHIQPQKLMSKNLFYCTQNYRSSQGKQHIKMQIPENNSISENLHFYADIFQGINPQQI